MASCMPRAEGIPTGARYRSLGHRQFTPCYLVLQYIVVLSSSYICCTVLLLLLYCSCDLHYFYIIS